jgi:hypothetical protein
MLLLYASCATGICLKKDSCSSVARCQNCCCIRFSGNIVPYDHGSSLFQKHFTSIVTLEHMAGDPVKLAMRHLNGCYSCDLDGALLIDSDHCTE